MRTIAYLMMALAAALLFLAPSAAAQRGGARVDRDPEDDFPVEQDPEVLEDDAFVDPGDMMDFDDEMDEEAEERDDRYDVTFKDMKDVSPDEVSPYLPGDFWLAVSMLLLLGGFVFPCWYYGGKKGKRKPGPRRKWQ